jgi:hypothetical protein
MRAACTVESPPARPSGSVEPWIEIAAWLLGFALLLAAPCAAEPPLDAGRGDGGGAAVSSQRAAAPPQR